MQEPRRCSSWFGGAGAPAQDPRARRPRQESQQTPLYRRGAAQGEVSGPPRRPVADTWTDAGCAQGGAWLNVSQPKAGAQSHQQRERRSQKGRWSHVACPGLGLFGEVPLGLLCCDVVRVRDALLLQTLLAPEPVAE